MKRWSYLFITLFAVLTARAQTYLGVFEKGNSVPFMVVAADAETGAPTTPYTLKFDIMRMGTSIANGTMAAVTLGVATGTYFTSADAVGTYEILVSGIINGVTAYTHQTYTLVEPGKGLASVADSVAGLYGQLGMSATEYVPYYNNILATIHTSAESVTQDVSSNIAVSEASLNAAIQNASSEVKIASREHSRSRLWYAQNTIDGTIRKVPADLPSHLEVQIAAPTDIYFATPIETFYRIYYYPNSATATKASKEIRSATPPADGSFYLSPDGEW